MQPIKATFELNLIPHEEMPDEQKPNRGVTFRERYYILNIYIPPFDNDEVRHELSFIFSEVENGHYRLSYSEIQQNDKVAVDSLQLYNSTILLPLLKTLFTMERVQTEIWKRKGYGNEEKTFTVYRVKGGSNTSNIEKTNSVAEQQTSASGNVSSFTLSRLLKYFCDHGDMTSEEGRRLKTGLVTLHSRLETHYAAQVQTQALQKVLSEQFGRMSRDVPPPPTNPAADLSSSPEWTGEQPKPSAFFHLTPNNK